MTKITKKKPNHLVPEKTSLTRRTFLSKAVLGTVGMALGSALSGGCFKHRPESSVRFSKNNFKGKPNVLFIINDQHHYGALGCAGHSLVKTPNLDKLARDGIFMDNAYCPAPVCGPSRTCIFTGYYPNRTKVLTNQRPFPPELTVLPEVLKQAGIQTGLVGKLHLWPMVNNWGFEYRRFNDSMNNTYSPEGDASDYIKWASKASGVSAQDLIKQFGADEESSSRLRFYMGSNITQEKYHYNTWTANESINFLNCAEKNRPFFLNIGFFGPHQPFLTPDPWTDMYDPKDVELMPQFYANMNDRPYFFEKLKKKVQRFKDQGWTENTWRRVLAAYYSQVSQIDYHIGRIIDKLKSCKLYDNTIIIFTADHGDHNGQFQLLQKGTMYEGSARVPLIIRDPDLAKGKRTSLIVNNIDLYRTILERYNLAVKADCPSRNLTPVLTGHSGDWDNNTRASLFRQSMLRRNELKLMRRDLGKKGTNPVYELYDLAKKPAEMKNVYNDPEYSQLKNRLKKELDSWHKTCM